MPKRHTGVVQKNHTKSDGGGGSNVPSTQKGAAQQAGDVVEPLRPMQNERVRVDAPWGGTSVFIIESVKIG